MTEVYQSVTVFLSLSMPRLSGGSLPHYVVLRARSLPPPPVQFPSAQKAVWKVGVGEWGALPRLPLLSECCYPAIPLSRYPGTGERRVVHVLPWGLG